MVEKGHKAAALAYLLTLPLSVRHAVFGELMEQPEFESVWRQLQLAPLRQTATG